MQPGKLEQMAETERDAILGECFAYDDQLRASGNFAGGQILQHPQSARTLHSKNGRVVVTDGPYAETKEQIGGLLVLEARDLNHAIELLSEHPAVKLGPWEIRPAADLREIIRASEERRSAR